jgi:DNA-binding PadR family transcriptional regulator
VTAVFSHGRLRLYLLRLLADGPKHGYELIRQLEQRFHGHYAPSAGTIYPRLQRLEQDGRVVHTAAGGRKVYEITEAGRAELRERAGELAALESDIRAEVHDLTTMAGGIRDEVHGSARDLKEELREAARQTRRGRPAPGGSAPDLTAEFEQRLTAFSTELRTLVRSARLSDRQLRTAIKILDGALDGLRRLLR